MQSLACLVLTIALQAAPQEPPGPPPPVPTKMPPVPGKNLPQPVPPAPQSAVQPEVLGPERQVYINQQGCYCVAQQVLQGNPNYVGKWRVKHRIQTPQGTQTYTASGYGAQSYATAHAGFLNWLNSTRARFGLPAVGYDPNLEAWVSQNNAAQRARGMGHFVMGPARRQNSAMSGGDPSGMWMTSPGHRSALLDPSIRAIGLAFDGQYWTFNAN